MRCPVFLTMMAAPILVAQVQPEALQILRRSASALQQFHSGEIETENTGIYQTTSQPLTIKALLLWSAPDKVRLTIGSDTAGQTSVTDGHTLSTYHVLTREYTRREAALPIAAAQTRALGALFSSDENIEIKSAKIVRGEQLSLRGAKFNCSVLEVEVLPTGSSNALRSYTLWVDKESGVILKQQLIATQDRNGTVIKSSSSLVVRHLVLNRPIDDRSFEFAPPGGAKIVDHPTYAEGAAFVGKSMPNLEFQNLDRTPFNLESLRGKTVLMSFGTTTCQPWLSQSLQLRHVTGQMAREDMAIILVDLNETVDAALAWREARGPEFPLIVARSFRFGSCPINFVIDKSGKVTNVDVGVESGLKVLERLKGAMAADQSKELSK
jgi:outer membrane lipoprotein-sorting protein